VMVGLGCGGGGMEVERSSGKPGRFGNVAGLRALVHP